MPTAETLAKMYIKNPPYVDKNHDEVRATPVENIVAAKELLEHNKSPTALETAVKLMTKALVQQEKATSSRRLESDPALCRSSTASKAQGAGNYGMCPDNESHTGSSEVRRREARNRADAIPISSDDKPHGKGPQRNPSPPRKNYPAYGYQQDNAAPRHKTNMPPPKYKTFEIPKGGIIIRDNDGKRGRSRDAGRRDDPPRWEASQDGGSKQRERSRHDDGAHRSGEKDKHRSSRCHDDKGKAPAAMTMIHLHGEQREAIVAAEINRRTARVKDDVILCHPHQAAPMAAAVAAADQQNHATLARIRKTRSPMTRVPT
jgi:hypothetical protein